MSKAKGTSLEQAMPKPSKSDTDYETENMMRTMHEASGIASDPSKLKKVHKLAGRKHKALMGMIEPMMNKAKSPKIRSLDDLKKKAYSQDNEPDGNDDMEM